MVTSFLLIVGGIFACYGLIVNKVKSIKDEFDAIIPYQGIAGILLMLFFLGDLFTLGTMIKMFSIAPFFAILQLISMLTKLVLGFVLTYGLVTKYVMTDETDAKEKTDVMYKTLANVQIPFGIIAIVIGFLGIILNIIY